MPKSKRKSPSPRKTARKATRKAAAPSDPAPRPGWTDASILRIARKSIQALKPYVPGKSIEEVQARYQPKMITKLGSNENPLGASPKVIEALGAALPKVSLYPDGSSGALRRALAECFGVEPGQIMVGNGSDEVLLLIAAAFLNPGEKVLVSENTFSEYEFAGRVMDGKIVKIPLRKHRYDLAAFKKKLATKPKLVFLCNPNNPTGTYFSHAELEALLRAAPPRTLVVVDEAYCEYADAPDFPRSLELLAAYPNLIISRTFSKIFGMAGLRLGYAFAHPLIIRETGRVKTPFNVNLLVQAAALAALSDGDFKRRSIANNLEGRAFLEKELAARGLDPLPTQANFICFRVPRPAVDVCEDMLKQGLIARALKSFGLEDRIRITIGTPDQNERFLQALDAALAPHP
ncbi:MAG: histidinol-phosphate transaminase [Fibrobacteres bacterium]|jgi:histidinol-phosphate aminotransferase|nr:histidinol-phosphate transaminase [Fibrobacterota bacterium]